MTNTFKLHITNEDLEEIKYHEKLKQISIYAYKEKGAKLPDGVFEMYPEIHMESGLDAFVLSDGDNIIVAFRGTELTNPRGIKTDFLSNDIPMYFDQVPQQAEEAVQLCAWLKEQYPDVNITVTGHSLGGGIGTYGAAKNGLEAVVFNPIGTAGLIESGEFIDDSRIVNYCNPRDWVASGNPKEHLGRCYEINSKGFTSQFNVGIQYHRIENMEDLRTRKIITKEELSRKYKEHLASIPDYLDTAIEAFKETFGINKLHQILSKCPGVYEVKGYVRKNGEKVKSYMRSCGFHH